MGAGEITRYLGRHGAASGCASRARRRRARRRWTRHGRHDEPDDRRRSPAVHDRRRARHSSRRPRASRCRRRRCSGSWGSRCRRRRSRRSPASAPSVRPTSVPSSGAFTMPTLVIHGDADTSQPIAVAREVAAAIPGGRLVEYAGGAARPLPDRTDAARRRPPSFVGET